MRWCKMEDLTKIVNIGPVLAGLLAKAGINSEAELKAAGSKKIFKRLKEMGEPDM
ncbi:TfoX/Sxy family protein [Desulfovibrio sp. OttesenSCG-928-F07]|nr:TfoX/Sxy family protein [Desulfovibrio sp. OttesenSCG-928-F07]